MPTGPSLVAVVVLIALGALIRPYDEMACFVGALVALVGLGLVFAGVVAVFG